MGALATCGMVTPQALPACVPRTAVFASRQCGTACRPSRRTLRCQVLAVGCLQDMLANRLLLGPSNASIAPRTALQASSSNGATATATAQPGLLLPCGAGGAWDEAGVGQAVVRYYLGDDEQRWFMWYTGRSEACQDMDDVFPSSGSIGEGGAGEEAAGGGAPDCMPSSCCCCTPHPPTFKPCPPHLPAGVAVSSDGITWQRGSGVIEGARGPQRALDVGKVLAPNGDWWWFDTCHLGVGDVQILSSNSIQSGEGVYWMFYSGGSFEQVALPAGLSQVRPLLGRRCCGS